MYHYREKKIFEGENVSSSLVKLKENKVFMVCKVDLFFSLCSNQIEEVAKTIFCEKKVCMFEFKNEPMEDFWEALEKKEE